MFCRSCKKNFVGDTPLCPRCEEKQIHAENVQKAKIVVKCIRRYHLLMFVRYGFFVALCVLTFTLFPFLPFLPLHLTAVLVLIITIYHVDVMCKEVRYWRVFKLSLDADDDAAFEERLLQFAPVGLYAIYASHEEFAGRKISNRVGVGRGIHRSALVFHFQDFETYEQAIRRYHNQADADEDT